MFKCCSILITFAMASNALPAQTAVVSKVPAPPILVNRSVLITKPCRANTISICSPNPCLHNGTCVSKSPLTGYKCTCKSGYTGSSCQTAISTVPTTPNNPCVSTSNPCQNNGTCIYNKNNTSLYDCHCLPGFSGYTCNVKAPVAPPPKPAPPCINAAGGNLCQNNGTCYTFGCSCLPGFSGALCDIVLWPASPTPMSPVSSPTIDVCKNSEKCLPGGQCVAVSQTSYMCHCFPGYFGEDCQHLKSTSTNTTAPSTVDCTGVCYNDGVAMVGADNRCYCACPSGTSGQHCEQIMDPAGPSTKVVP